MNPCFRTTLVVSSLAVAACRPDAAGQRVQWEYTTIAGSPDPMSLPKVLNDAGREGWELVALDSAPPPYGRVYILKRAAPKVRVEK